MSLEPNFPETQTSFSVDQSLDFSFVDLIDQKLQEDLLSIPDKMLFKIGEVSGFASIKPYVLRYWESEFSLLRPKKASNNQRMYTKKDVEIVLLIKKLLYRDRYSIQGAKKALVNMKLELKNFNKWNKIVKTQNLASDKLLKLIDNIRSLRRKFKAKHLNLI